MIFFEIVEEIWHFSEVQNRHKKLIFFLKKHLAHGLPATRTNLYVQFGNNRSLTSVSTHF